MSKLGDFARWKRARSLVEAKVSPKVSRERARNGLKPVFPAVGGACGFQMLDSGQWASAALNTVHGSTMFTV